MKNETGRKSLDVVNDDSRVAKLFHDEDGYWLWLVCGNGWTCDVGGAHDGHEDTVKDILRVYRRMSACDCAECKPVDVAPAVVAPAPDQSVGARSFGVETHWTDERGDEHALCVFCSVDCSTHADAGNSLACCGDCGRATCPDHRVDDAASRCVDCAAVFYASPAPVVTKAPKAKRAKAPAFTDGERALLQATASAVWDEIAYDVLQATADDKGKDINAVTISRPVVIELALDAGRLVDKLGARRRRELARGGEVLPLVTDDLLARWDAARYAQKIAIVKPAFAYTRYGL